MTLNDIDSIRILEDSPEEFKNYKHLYMKTSNELQTLRLKFAEEVKQNKILTNFLTREILFKSSPYGDNIDDILNQKYTSNTLVSLVKSKRKNSVKVHMEKTTREPPSEKLIEKLQSYEKDNLVLSESLVNLDLVVKGLKSRVSYLEKDLRKKDGILALLEEKSANDDKIIECLKKAN